MRETLFSNKNVKMIKITEMNEGFTFLKGFEVVSPECETYVTREFYNAFDEYISRTE